MPDQSHVGRRYEATGQVVDGAAAEAFAVAIAGSDDVVSPRCGPAHVRRVLLPVPDAVPAVRRRRGGGQPRRARPRRAVLRVAVTGARRRRRRRHRRHRVRRGEARHDLSRHRPRGTPAGRGDRLPRPLTDDHPMTDAPAAAAPVDRCGRRDDAAVSRTVTQEQITAYADASGDHNPIHVDPEFARSVGLPGTIAHGLLDMAILTEAVGRWAGGYEQVASVACRFSKPLLPGETVTCTGRVVADRRSTGHRHPGARGHLEQRRPRTHQRPGHRPAATPEGISTWASTSVSPRSRRRSASSPTSSRSTRCARSPRTTTRRRRRPGPSCRRPTTSGSTRPAASPSSTAAAAST